MDIDIDLPSTFDPLTVFPQAVRASIVKDKNLIKHPCGIYLQNIPKDSTTNLSAIPYQQAEHLNYFKIDFLHLTILDCFENKSEIRALLKKSPNWDLLKSKQIVEQLFQVRNNYELLQKIKPQSVQEMADCIALIRPGKQFLIDIYHKNKEYARQELYKKTDKYYFKKSHAISYALTIVLQLHLIEASIL